MAAHKALEVNMSLDEFYSLMDTFDWNYMNPEGEEPKEDESSDRRTHIEMKDLALRRHADGHAALYLAFEDYAYYSKPKPERPK